MKLYDVYNDGGFVMRTTLPMVAHLFDLSPTTIDRARRGQVEVRTDGSKFRGFFTIFPATNDLQAESHDIFSDANGNHWGWSYNRDGKRVRVCIPKE